jgi:hypothetical protein
MRISNHFIPLSFLFLMFGAMPVAHAQVSEAQNAKRIADALTLLEQGNEEKQGAALFQLAQLGLPPAQGVPLFRSHLQRRTKTLAEALAITHAVEGLAHYGTEARPTLPDLIRLLDDVGTIQGEATYGRETWWWLTTALSEIGPNDRAAIEALKRAVRRGLDSPEKLETLIQESATALGRMGRAANTAVPLLTLALGRTPREIPSIASALSHMMPQAVLSVPALVRALEAGRSQDAVMDALGAMGPAARSALPALHRALALPSPEASGRAFAAIAHIEGQPKLTEAEALAVLQKTDSHTLTEVYTAFATVKREGKRTEAVAAALAQIVIRRKEPWLRRTAIETLAAVGPAGNREAALALVRAVQRQDPVIALGFPEAFEEFGSSAEQVVPELSVLLRNEDARLQEAVLMLLFQIGRKAAPALPEVIRLLQQSVRDDRFTGNPSQILWLLDSMGSEAKAAAPVLIDLLLTPKKHAGGTPFYNRVSLLYTLMQIGLTPRVLPVVREMLQSEHPTEVACAAHAVARLGPLAADTAPLLLRPLRPGYKDALMTSGFFYGYVQETSARIESMRALTSLGPAAQEALPLLQRYADGPDMEALHLSRGSLDLKAEAQRAIQAIRQIKGA